MYVIKFDHNKRNCRTILFEYKLILFILICLSLFKKAYSQNIFTDLKSLEKRGDYYYSKLSYSKSIDFYAQALQKKKNKFNYTLNIKAANLYRMMARYNEAKNCFDNILASGHSFSAKDSIDYYNILKAADTLNTKALLPPNYSGKILNSLFRDSLYYNLYELPFNTIHSEYCPVFFGNGLMYVSDQHQSSLVKTYNAINNGGFASIYYAEKKDTNWVDGKGVDIGIKNALHLGPISLYNDQKNAVINACIEGSKKPYRLSLYTAEYDQEKEQWKTLQEMPFNSTSYSVGHPSMSEDGKKIFFISDMPGGVGGTDIYMSGLNDGKWSDPINLGSKINTVGNEKYPYISKDNILFFSSDGRYGMGGSDIYYVDLDFKDSIVANMGYPVNSTLDDFSFNFDPIHKIGYFSSNRKDQGKQDDIYMFTENKIYLNVTFKDDFDKSDLKEADVQLWDSELKTHVRFSQEKGASILSAWLRPAHQYKMIIQKEDYKKDTLLISTYGINNYSDTISKTFFVKRKSIYFANLKLKNEELKRNISDALIVINNLTDKNKDTILHTDLSKNIKLDAECEYIVTVRNGDTLRYILVEKKVIRNNSYSSYYNMYLSKTKPVIMYGKVKKCSDNMLEENSKLMLKVYDHVSGNEFSISPGPDGGFQFNITDHRLFDVYLNGSKILYSKEKNVSQDYCLSFIND